MTPRVVVAGVDAKFRPHYCGWLTKAFRRLGCEVVRVGPAWTTPGDDSFVGPAYEPVDCVVNSGMIGISEVLQTVGGKVDLVVMVDQGDGGFAVHLGGDCPAAYVWRECNPGEASRAVTAAADKPLFGCMTGPSKASGTIPLPFAVDSELFLQCRLKSFDERSHTVMYSGRERGNGTFARFHRMGDADTPGYVSGYQAYRDRLLLAKHTVCMDSATYVGSRALEAMACGVVTFWDHKEGAVGWMNFDWGTDCLNITRTKCPATQEWLPGPDLEAQIVDLMQDKPRWTAISKAGRAAIFRAQTYEHRAQTIAKTCGVTLPRSV